METSIALSACGAFGNAGGELNCDTPANADGIPEGSYLGSCGGCSLAKLPTTELPGNVLTCTHCKMGDGQLHESNIDTSECHQETHQIGNSDGRLVCEEIAAEEPAPDGRRLEELPENVGVPIGSYTGSCGGCTLEDVTVSCEGCLNGAGTLVPSSIVDRCPDGEHIGNIDGVLTCEAKPVVDEAAEGEADTKAEL